MAYFQDELWIAVLKPEYDPDNISKKQWEKSIQDWKDQGYVQKSADWLKTRPEFGIKTEIIGKRAIIAINNVMVTKDDSGNLLVFVKE